MWKCGNALAGLMEDFHDCHDLLRRSGQGQVKSPESLPAGRQGAIHQRMVQPPGGDAGATPTKNDKNAISIIKHKNQIPWCTH